MSKTASKEVESKLAPLSPTATSPQIGEHDLGEVDRSGYELGQFAPQFAEMVSMKAFDMLRLRLSADPDTLQLVEGLYMLQQYLRHLEQDDEGEVLWINNQSAAEAIGEISHLVDWPVG